MLSVQGESRSAVEHLVGGKQRGSDMDSCSCDPEVTGVSASVQWVTRNSASQTQLCNPGQQGVGDRDNRSRTNGLFEVTSSGFAPSRYEGAISEFGLVLVARKIWFPAIAATAVWSP